jgi:hypothetical protein
MLHNSGVDDVMLFACSGKEKQLLPRYCDRSSCGKKVKGG